MPRGLPCALGSGAEILCSRVGRRVTLLFVLAAFLPLAALALMTLDHLQGELLRQAGQSLRETAKSTGMAVAERLHRLELEARLAGTRLNRTRPRPGPVSLVADARRHFKGFFWVPPDAAGAPRSLPALTPRQRAHLRAGRALLVTTPGGADQQRVYLVLRVDPLSGNGALLWGELDMDFLLGGASRAPPPSLALILDDDGRVLWSAGSGPAVARAMHGALQADGSGLFHWQADGAAHLGTAWDLFMAPSLGASWTVVSERPEAEVLVPLRGFRTLFLLVAALTFSVVLLVVVVQIRRSLTPLSALTRATHELAERRLGARVSIATGDEFEDLGRSFNRMAEDLEEYIRQTQAAARASAAITVRTETGDLLQAVLQGAMDVANADGGALYEIAGDGRPRLRLLHVASRDLSMDRTAEDSGHGRAPSFRPPAGASLRTVVERAGSVLVADPDPGDSGTLAEVFGYEVNALLAVPLHDDKGAVVGAVQLFNRRDRRNGPGASFTDHDADMVEALADQAAVAMGRNRLTAELAASESRYRSLVHNSPGPIFVHDRQGRLTYVNPAWARLLGHPADAIRGRSFSEFLSPETGGAFDEYLASLDDPNGSSGVLHVCTRAGEPRVWAYRLVPLGEETSGVFLVHAQDITERERLEAGLRQAQRIQALGTLAGGIAHDFNNLLTPIMAYTEMSVDDLPEDDRVRSYLEKVLAASHRAKGLVDQILSFSRQDDPGRQVIRLHPLVKELVKLLEGSVNANIEVRAEIDPSSGPVLADPTQVHQVLLNLCTNAALAMEHGGGELFVRLEPVTAREAAAIPGLEARPHVRLTVRDTGCGIPPELHARVFEPFFTTRPAGEGTGLGLATVHGIVSRMGGRIILDSQVGVGTSFEVYLPRARGEAGEASGSVEVARGNRERVLYVDDQPDLAELGREMLATLGYEPVVRTGGTAALDAFREDPDGFDLVITDQQMPDLHGAQLLGALRRIRPDIPAILLTGFSRDYDEKRALAAGFDAFCAKPVTVPVLSGVIRKVLDARGRCAAAPAGP